MVYDFNYAFLYEHVSFVVTLLALFLPIVLLSVIFALIDYLRKHLETNILKLVFYSILFLQASCRAVLAIFIYAGSDKNGTHDHSSYHLYFDFPSLLLMAMLSLIILQVDRLFPRTTSVNRRRLALFVCNIGVCLIEFGYYMFSGMLTPLKAMESTSFLEAGSLVVIIIIMIWSFRSNWTLHHHFMNEKKLAGAFITCCCCLLVRVGVTISGIYTEFSPYEKPEELEESKGDSAFLAPVVLYYGMGEAVVGYICLYIQYLTPHPVISDDLSVVPLLSDLETGKVKASELVQDYYKIESSSSLSLPPLSSSSPPPSYISSSSSSSSPPPSSSSSEQENNQNTVPSEALRFFKLFEKSLNSTNVVLHEVLGKGGSGAIVYRCTLREGPFSGGTFAVKVMKDCVPADLDALMNEVRIYQSLKHNNIVKFMGADLSTPKREVRIFMEFIPDTLDVNIRKRTMYGNLHYFTASQIAKYMLQLISGLQVLHGRNIIHRDLKTSNIFVVMGNSGDISDLKIGDFDVSTFLKRTTPRSRVGYHTANKGTDSFMAPEMMASNTTNKVKYDAKVDIWSMGMILYSMLTLHEPYENENRFERGWDKPPTLTPEVSNNPKYAKLIEIFAKCSASKAEDRPTCDNVATLLQNALASSPL